MKIYVVTVPRFGGPIDREDRQFQTISGMARYLWTCYELSSLERFCQNRNLLTQQGAMFDSQYEHIVVKQYVTGDKQYDVSELSDADLESLNKRLQLLKWQDTEDVDSAYGKLVQVRANIEAAFRFNDEQEFTADYVLKRLDEVLAILTRREDS